MRALLGVALVGCLILAGCFNQCRPSSENRGSSVRKLELWVLPVDRDSDSPKEMGVQLTGAHAPVGVPFAANVTLVLRRLANATMNVAAATLDERSFQVRPREFAHSDEASREGCIYWYGRVWYDDGLFSLETAYSLNATVQMEAYGRHLWQEPVFEYAA